MFHSISKALSKGLTIEHFVDGVMVIFALASVGNVSEYMIAHGHNHVTAYGVGIALGFGLVAASILLARLAPSDGRPFWFMLVAVSVFGLLSGTVQSFAYLEHRPGDPFAAYLQGFGFPLVGECLLAVAMSVYTEAQKQKRLNASDDQLNERINEFLNKSLDDVDLSKLAQYIERQVGLIVRNKIDALVAQRLAQNEIVRTNDQVGRSEDPVVRNGGTVGRTEEPVGRTEEPIVRNSPNQDAQDDHITTKNDAKLGEANDAKQRKLCERREAIVRMVETFGPMSAPELVEKLGEDCGIKASAQTVRDDCALLVEESKLVVDGRKWSRIAVVVPTPVEFSTNGHSHH